MADGGSGGDVIIKGGSVEVQFDSSIYRKELTDPSTHKADTRKITRVKVEDEDNKPLFDSGPAEGGLKWTITVSTSDK